MPQATLQDPKTGNKVVVTSGSPEASKFLSQGYSLYKDPAPIGSKPPTNITPTTNAASGIPASTANSTSTGTPNPNSLPDLGVYGQALNEMRTKLTANNDLVSQKNLLLKQIYSTPLTPEEMKVLSPSQQQAIHDNNSNMIDMEIRLVNDQIQNRTNTLDTSINYITGLYTQQKQDAETKFSDAQNTVISFIQQYGSNAPAALASLYGPEKLQQLKDMGIDVARMASLPTLSETKTALSTSIALSKISAQYGTSTGGLDINIPANTLAGKNNNPGNLRFVGQAGASQGAGGFAKFDTPQDGFQAMIDDVTMKMTGNSSNVIPDGPNKGKKLGPTATLEDLIRVYAPSADSNDPNGYAKTVANALGVSSSTQLSQIDPGDLAAAMAQHESGTTVSVSQSDSTINATMLTTGQLVPSMISAYGGARNRAIAEAKRLDPNFDPTKAELAYTASKKWVATQNSSQMVRFYGLATSVVNTIDEVKQKADAMKLGGIPLMNKAQLTAYIQTQGNSQQGQLATQYLTAVNTLKEEFANLAQGGYAPTEAAWKLANSQIDGTYGSAQLGASLTEVQRLINFRVNALKDVAPQVPGQADAQQATVGSPTANPVPAKWQDKYSNQDVLDTIKTAANSGKYKNREQIISQLTKPLGQGGVGMSQSEASGWVYKHVSQTKGKSMTFNP